MTGVTAEVPGAATPEGATARSGLLGGLTGHKALELIGPAAIIVLIQLAFFRMPLGAYLYGLVLGLLGALAAIGMALIYRANRIFNFAQGDLGTAPTVFAVGLITFSGWNYFLSLGIGLLGALILGSVVEVLIIRRFFRAPRLILTVATIGLAQLIAGASLLIPRIWGEEPTSQKPFAPFDLTFEIAPMTFHANEVIALVIAPLLLVGVALFLRYTSVGIAVRASAERADRASSLGVPVMRLQNLVWCIAAVLSFAAIFLRAGITGLPFAANAGFGTTSFGTLLAALAALTLGRFTNLPAIATSAIALGILEQGVIWNNSNNPNIVYPVFALIILVGLVFRKTGDARTDHDSAATWSANDEIRSIPRELRRVPEVFALRWGGLALLALIAIELPNFLGAGDQYKAAAVVIFAIIGISIVVLTGWAGQVSLGQMGFVGYGAAVGALVTKQWHLDLGLALLISGSVGALVAVLVGLPALRLRGLFLAVTSLAFTITASAYLLNPRYPVAAWIPTGRIPRPELFGSISLEGQSTYYLFCLACLGLVVLAVSGLRRSRTGRVLLALRENERGAQSFGINVVRAKLLAFAISGFLAAFAGCLFVHLLGSFTVEPYDPAQSFNVFTSAVVGGLGSMTGGVLGAIFSRGGTWFLQGAWVLIPSAIGVLFVLLVFPSGLGGLFFRLRDLWLRSVARRNAIVVPSLLADVRVDAEPLEHAERAVETEAASAGASVPAAASAPAGATPPPAGPGDDGTDEPVGASAGGDA